MGLTLSRKVGQSLVINDDLEIMVTLIKGTQVRISVFGDPQKYRVLRGEHFDNEEFRKHIEELRKRNDTKTSG